ncbi:MAG: chemotaxis protein CheW [Hyphomicrobium sp.]
MYASSAAAVLEPKAGAARELITFAVGNQEFCIDVMSVREIRGWTPATVLPHSQPFVRGVINLRGAVLPIMDLAVRLGFPAAEPMGRHVIIVVQVGSQVAGLLVDAGLRHPDGNGSRDPAAARCRVRHGKAVRVGLLAMDGRMVSLLSVNHVLPERERSDPQ